MYGGKGQHDPDCQQVVLWSATDLVLMKCVAQAAKRAKPTGQTSETDYCIQADPTPGQKGYETDCGPK